MHLFVQAACARADFATWANRSTRPTEPVGYDVNGTSVQMIVAWPGVRGIGNLGIGNGNISLMKPEVINAAIKNATVGMSLSEDKPAGNESPAQRNVTNASETEVSEKANATSNVEAQQEAVEEYESLLPEQVAAASFITRGEPYSITINRPLPNILKENPTEPGVLYAKMLGLPLPGGRYMDMGIKSLGSEF